MPEYLRPQLNQIQTARLNGAVEMTVAQIAQAKAIHLNQFNGNNSEYLLPAIIQALATNYAATVLSNGEG